MIPRLWVKELKPINSPSTSSREVRDEEDTDTVGGDVGHDRLVPDTMLGTRAAKSQIDVHNVDLVSAPPPVHRELDLSALRVGATLIV